MRRPRIGIPLGLDDRGRWRRGRDYLYIDRRYSDAIARAGGVALHLPIQDDVLAVAEEIDGLLLPGGDDLPADIARGESAASAADLDIVPPDQLRFDTALLAASQDRGLPILGICYGMQLLARSGGGRLIIHLPTERPEAAGHKMADDDARHEIEVEAHTRLARILGAERGAVNSLHHQAVAEVGRRHRVSARSPDGVIEAIEATVASPFEVGVQWHPEKLDTPESRALFGDFVTSCQDRAQSRQDG
jgi:putative glutamine amidotransferase